jgi:PTH1 family peptidyl-tRNA hydrolase
MAEDAPLLVEDRDSSFQNKVHLAMEAKGFTDETDDDLPASK